ncbi:MAG: RyR domain-containing protein [Armatimonadota bacterium]
METNYVPKPLAVDHIEIEPHLFELVELLSEHAHDKWAQQRISDGWRFGSERHDGDKTHPCLISYSDLPEQEKTYDRNAVIGTLQAILALGFTISAPISILT